MFKGAKKAIVRAPHRIAGSKSIEDRVIVEWTKDFNTADAALDLISSEAKEYAKAWRELLSSDERIVAVMKEIYSPILEENVYRSVQETPRSSLDALHGFEAVTARIGEDIMPLIEHLEVFVIENSKLARECIEGVKKALRKREHKKVDFDRHSNGVEKLQKKQGLTDKEQQHLSKLEMEQDEAMEVFHAQDAKCKETIPFVLTLLSEFLNPLASQLYLTQLRILEICKNEMYKYAVSQGLARDYEDSQEAYTHICDTWEESYLKIQPAAEVNIKSIAEGDTVQRPMDMPSHRKRDKAAAVFSSASKGTASLAKSAFTRVKHPHVRSIQFSSPEQGMFRSEADILRMPAGSPVPSSSSPRDSILSDNSSSFQTATPHYTYNSPYFDSSNSIDNRTRTRVRAFSSASARAISVSSLRNVSGSHSTTTTTNNSQLSAYAIKKRSESDQFAKASFTFAGDEPGDVAFRKGDKIRVLDQGDETDDQWWFGETLDGRLGLFPCNYVELES